MTDRDHFQAESPEPLVLRPDPQYQEAGAWGCVLGVAIVVLVLAGALTLIYLIGKLD